MNYTKAVDRAAKLRAQMESEHALGNQEAAHAFAAAMSRLMLEHELNDAVIEAHRLAGTRPVEEPITEHIVDLSKLSIEPSSKRNASLESLAGIVGRAHLCKILICAGRNRIWFVGTQTHIDVAEYMLAQMWRALQKLAAQGRRAAKREGKNITHYTSSFKHGFTSTLDQRYGDERRQVVEETDEALAHANQSIADDATPLASVQAQSALMVLNNAVARTQAYVDAHYGKKTCRSVGWSSGYNSRGRTDGANAAASIGLRANGLKAGTTRAALRA